jgi:hypothetical protein
MAFLIAVQLKNGDWQAHVVAHPSSAFCGDIDVIGRRVPSWRFIEAWEGVKKDDAVRLAQTLKGAPKTQRRQLILEQAKGLRLSARGGTLLKL